MPIVCVGCGLRVSPIEVFEPDARKKTGWIITRCPRERCGFNIDIAEASDHHRSPKDKDGRRYIWNGKCWE